MAIKQKIGGIMGQLGQIGKNGVEEFFEEITFGLGNSFDVVQNLPKTDYDLINEAMQSGVSIVKMGFMMLILQRQEQLIDKISGYLFAGVASTLGGGMKLLKKGLGRFKGIKQLRRMPLFATSTSDSIALCRLGSELAVGKFSSKNSSNSALDRFNVSMNKERNIQNEEKLKLNLATAKSSNYNQALMFKLMSSGFTPKDKVLLKRILGKENNLDIEDLNKVSQFMWTKDNNGNVVGLSQEFMSLINGLGYLHNKG